MWEEDSDGGDLDRPRVRGRSVICWEIVSYPPSGRDRCGLWLLQPAAGATEGAFSLFSSRPREGALEINRLMEASDRART